MLRLFILLSNLPIHIRARFAAMAQEFRADVSGAEIVEYAVMIGLLTAVAIATILLVGNWVANEWSFLCSVALQAGNVTC